MSLIHVKSKPDGINIRKWILFVFALCFSALKTPFMLFDRKMRPSFDPGVGGYEEIEFLGLPSLK